MIINGIAPLPKNARHDSPVHEYEGPGGSTNKVNYTVPVGMNLFIEHWHVAISEGDKYILELEVDGFPMASIGGGEAKEGGENVLFPLYNPLGPFSAGSLVRINRDEGSSGKDWSGGFIGYLEEE